jgi:hypothetical protein
MHDVLFVNFHGVDTEDHYSVVAELIRSLSSVTSIYLPHCRHLPAIQRDALLFIHDDNSSNRIENFLHDNQSQLAYTRHTHVFIDTVINGFYPSIGPSRIRLAPGDKIAVSFFGPPSGTLVLVLTHSPNEARIRMQSSGEETVTFILKESHGSRTFEYPIPSSLTATNITLFPSPSDHPSFVPNIRNNLIIEVTQKSQRGFVVRDIQLHDEEGNDYGVALPEA